MWFVNKCRFRHSLWPFLLLPWGCISASAKRISGFGDAAATQMDAWSTTGHACPRGPTAWWLQLGRAGSGTSVVIIFTLFPFTSNRMWYFCTNLDFLGGRRVERRKVVLEGRGNKEWSFFLSWKWIFEINVLNAFLFIKCYKWALRVATVIYDLKFRERKCRCDDVLGNFGAFLISISLRACKETSRLW